MSKVTTFAAFLVGAAIGSVGTWYALKNRYEQIAEEEIESVRQYYGSKLSSDAPEEVEENDISEEPAVDENPLTRVERNEAKLIAAESSEKHDYTAHSADKMPKKETPKLNERPYVISSEEFGLDQGYEQYEMYYFQDNVITDDNYDIVDNFDDIVGNDVLEYFGEYETDTVYVQNDQRECYYSIFKDERTYEEVLEQMPYKREVL